ncbi:MAG: glycosyltransferase family 4 protein [Candidatus Saccharibacteria bacterium]|nr:glycosyltransferase family 4 protein [Candidatus Saccharibacteria bacterium]
MKKSDKKNVGFSNQNRVKSQKKKVLFVATVDSHIELFHLPYLKYFKDKKYEVHVATDTDKPIKYCDKKIKISIARSPFKLKNLKAIKELKQVINTEKYDIIHCHTPMGGVVARLAARKARKNGTRVIYTAHGFHFYKGAPLKNWLLFYPVEKYLAKYTDTLITINDEDYNRAKKKFSCNRVYKIHGIGVDENKFKGKLTKTQKKTLRKKLGLNENDFVITYVAELIHRKNQAMAIEYMRLLKCRGVGYIKLLLIGKDSYDGKYQKLVDKLDLNNEVKFLGFRKDVGKIMQISDLEIGTSRQEGLGLHLAEAMLLNIPVIATVDRGHKELIKNNYNGFLVKQNDGRELAADIAILINNDKLGKKIAANGKKTVKKFLLSNVIKEMVEIYENK